MEEGVAAPVRRIDAAAQIVPAPDAVHRLVADDLFQDHRRRRPVDPAQHQEAAVEPRREQMHEVGIDRLEILAVIERIEQLLAHAHQRGGAARREIEPAQQFLPARPRRRHGFRRRSCRRARPARRRWRHRAATRSGPKRFASASKKAMRGPVVSSAYLARISSGQRHARRLAAPGQQFLAQFRQTFRARSRIAAAVARAVEQRPAALGNAVEHLAEKGRVHRRRQPHLLSPDLTGNVEGMTTVQGGLPTLWTKSRQHARGSLSFRV